MESIISLCTHGKEKKFCYSGDQSNSYYVDMNQSKKASSFPAAQDTICAVMDLAFQMHSTAITSKIVMMEEMKQNAPLLATLTMNQEVLNVALLIVSLLIVNVQ